MVDETLAETRRALESNFYQRQHEALLGELRQERSTRAQASRASGVTDELVLDLVLRVGMAAETLAALSLVPLVEVAWADGKMESTERSTVLSAAAAQGIEKGTPGFDLLQSWLEQRPNPSLIDAWTGYVQALSTRLSADDRETLRRDLLRRARTVAEAAGGFLRLGSKVSAEEAEVLAKLDAAFQT